MTKTVWWHDDHPAMLDQTRLPFEEVELHCRSMDDVAEAITSLRVRGAPAIGVAAAYGVAFAASGAAKNGMKPHDAVAVVEAACDQLARTRPTAVNLFWAIDRMRRVARAEVESAPSLAARLLVEARAIEDDDALGCRRMGELGAPLIGDGMSVLTHCNAGALATAGIGTATAPIFVAQEQGKRPHVYVDETRPLLQGARLTAWELHNAGVSFTLITDNMAAHAMRLGRVQAVFVGADRIAANGDVANKIGTYGVALAARAHALPFYVVAPFSTVDLDTANGTNIVIEERPHYEVRNAHGHRLVPDSYPVFNPAFDITPGELVTAIITERGIVRPSFALGLASIASEYKETA
jgi:methylthioribose-1-phosphate isomerase